LFVTLSEDKPPQLILKVVLPELFEPAGLRRPSQKDSLLDITLHAVVKERPPTSNDAGHLFTIGEDGNSASRR
jgi:hypothetical protein